jgi:hypothetical protein
MQPRSEDPCAKWTDIAILLVAWLIVLAAFAAAAHCKPAPLQTSRAKSPSSNTPSLDDVDRYGYIIEQVARARYPSTAILEGYEGTVWVSYKDSQPEWRFTLTFRPKRAEAVRDCEAWMDRVERALEKTRKRSR